MSLAELLGLSETVQTTLVLLAVALALAPILSGVKIGGVEIPRIDRRRRRALHIGGPASLLAALVLVVPIPALRPHTTNLRLVAADVLENGDIDVAVTNTGPVAVLLTAIELEVIGERAAGSRPVLETSATYRVPIGDLTRGHGRRRVIRHLVAAGTTERFSIHPETAYAATVQLSLFSGDGTVMRAQIDLQGVRRKGNR